MSAQAKIVSPGSARPEFVPAETLKEESPVRQFGRPVVKKSRWPSFLIWLIPLCALLAAAGYLKMYLADQGATVTLRFSDADGIKPGNTLVLHRGVAIGQVTDVELSPDERQVLIKVRLRRSQEVFARAGSAFWVVRPEISDTGLTGLNTVFSGPYIEAIPGNGAQVAELNGLSEAPHPMGAGVHFVLHAPRLDHLQNHSPVFYRGIQVGMVNDIRLNREADGVQFGVVVWNRYAKLVRANSRFWGVSGFDVKGGIFSGVSLKLESLKTMVTGGIAFATPDKEMGPPVREGASFTLADEAKDEWREWAPKIPIAPVRSSSGDDDQAPVSGRELVGTALKGGQ